MKNTLKLREFKKEDTKALTAIIRKTWHYDEFCSPQIAEDLAHIFLISCLANQTYTRVATIDEMPVGIIMGKNIKKYKVPLHYLCQQVMSIIQFYLKKEGRKVFQLFAHVDSIDKDLLQQCQQNFGGEVAFFAIDESYRGHGIGRELFQSLLSYMQNENIKQFYLYTDTSCNYGFYEHLGMHRECEKAYTFTIANQQQDMSFYLYSYSV